MAQEQITKIQFFASGFCTASAYVVDPKRGKGNAKFAAVWALIHLAENGYALFDTGYGPDFFKATATFPDRLYAWATPVFLREHEPAGSVLLNEGIKPEEIRYVFISHFHADHIAGLSAFPQAQIICSRAAWEEWTALNGLKAVQKGLLKTLLPYDFFSNIRLIEDISEKVMDPVSGLVFHRLWGQSAFSLAELPGHARGMVGFLYKSADQHIFYATDAAWNYEQYRRAELPSVLVRLFIDSWQALADTQQKIRLYEDAHPDCIVLFTHCPKTLTYLSARV